MSVHVNDGCNADCAQLLCARLHSGESLSAEEEDVDVARERQRVYEGKAQNDLLRILDLTKVLAGTFFHSVLIKSYLHLFLWLHPAVPHRDTFVPVGQQDGNSII